MALRSSPPCAFQLGWWFRLRLWDGASLLLLCEWQAKFEDVRETLWG